MHKTQNVSEIRLVLNQASDGKYLRTGEHSVTGKITADFRYSGRIHSILRTMVGVPDGVDYEGGMYPVPDESPEWTENGEALQTWEFMLHWYETPVAPVKRASWLKRVLCCD